MCFSYRNVFFFPYTMLMKLCICFEIYLSSKWFHLRLTSLEGMMLKLILQYFGHLKQRVDSLEKTDAGRDWGQEEKGTTEDEMAGWHLRLNGHEFE